MKKENLPQDKSALQNFTREVCYVKGEEGYEKGLSTGWEVKSEALDAAWVAINKRIQNAANAVAKGEKSPILFFMELNLMDYQTLAGYTNFWKFTIKRHMNPGTFKKLGEKKLKIYAETFKISVDELRKFDGRNTDSYIRK